MFKNVASQRIVVYATEAGLPKTGDAANITAYLDKDGGGAVQTNDLAPTELDATNLKGLYAFDMLQAETNADLVALSPVSATSNVTLEPVIIYTVTPMRGTDSANTTTPDAAGTAATLHGITDGKVDALVTPDAAGTAATLHGITDGKVDALVTPDAAGVAAGLHATTDGKIDAVQGDVTTVNGVVDSILVDTALMDKWLKNKITFSGTSMILYDDNGVTPLITWTLSEGSTTVSGPYNRSAGA